MICINPCLLQKDGLASTPPRSLKSVRQRTIMILHDPQANRPTGHLDLVNQKGYHQDNDGL